MIQCKKSDDIFKSAKKDMEAQSYCEAIDKLKKIETNDEDDYLSNKIIIRLAQCYAQTLQYDKAEEYYGKIVRFTNVEPTFYLYYAQMLQINGKCDLAKEWFIKFNKAVPEDVRGQYAVNACDYSEMYIPDSTYKLDKCLFNTANSESLPTEDNGKFLYTVQESDVCMNNFLITSGRSIHSAIGISRNTSSVVLNLKKIEIDNVKCELFSISNLIIRGNKAFFSAKTHCSNNSQNKVPSWHIYTADWVNDKLLNIKSLPFNHTEYSTLMPSLSEDGLKMYFASNIPGGFGGMDLYVSNFEQGQWEPLVNLGPEINTEGDEITPYLHNKNTLYFASNGHLGMGGFDIIYVKIKDNGTYDISRNIRAPINSLYDDFGFSIDKKGISGIFSSNRPGGKGLSDIYGFIKTSPQ